MVVEFKLTEATAEAVARQLSSDPGWGSRSLTWTEMACSGGVGIGEVRNPSDWYDLPRDVELRVVALKISSQDIIRWATNDALTKIGGSTHHFLICRDDPIEGMRSGYVRIDKDGRHIRVA